MSVPPVKENADSPAYLNILLNMDTTQLARIPEERWPQRLSRKLLETLPENKRRVVSRILHLRLNQRPQAGTPTGTDPDPQLVELHDLLARWLNDLGQELDCAEQAIRQWRQVQGGRARDNASTEDESIRLFDQCIDRGSQLALHMNSRRLELQNFVQRLQTASAIPAARQGTDLKAQLEAAAALLTRMQDLGSRYYLLRLNLVWMEMTRAQSEVARCARRQRQLGEDAKRVLDELRQAGAWAQRVTGRSKPSQIAALRDMVQSLEQDRLNCVYEIPSEEMHGWLNAVVDAYLDPRCNEIARSQVQKSVRAFMDLARYRRQVSRRQQARAAATGQSAPKAIDDSRLIESCIDGHKPDIWQQMVLGAPQIRERLDQLRQQLIEDYRVATAERASLPG